MRRIPETLSVLTLVITAMAASGAAAEDQSGASRATDANPYFGKGAVEGSGEGLTIGYIEIGPAGHFTDALRDGIEREAETAGAELIYCDSNFDPDLAVACGRLMARAGAEGVLNFQVSEADSGRVCTSYGSLPTIAIDVRQSPCERSYVGADNPLAGFVAGEALGQLVRDEHDCEIDTILVLNAPNTGVVGVERTEGMVDGFESVCGPSPDGVVRRFDIGNEAQSQEVVLNAIGGLAPGGLHAVFAINEQMTVGADEASKRLSREGEFLFVSQDFASTVDRLACDDRWVAATAYFPELYGATLIPAMIDLINGEEVPPELLTVHEVVTKDNLHEFVDEIPDCSGFGAT